MNKLYKNLKAISFLVSFLGYLFSTQAQTINNYVFSTNTSSSLSRTFGSLIDDIDMTLGTTILIGGSVQSPTLSTATTMPFDFWINGTRVASSYTVSNNGWVFLNGSSVATTPFSTSYNGTNMRLAPFLGSMGTSTIGTVHSKVFGSQPNRVLVIEYLRMAVPTGVVNDTNTFQVRLYESNGAIEYVYGRMQITSASSQSYNTGIHLGNGFSTASYFQHVNTSTHTTSTSNSTPNTYAPGVITDLNGTTPGSQRAYMWVPDPPDDVTAISFSNITATSMTLQWTSPSNENGIAVYRSTDGINYTNVLNLLSSTISSWTMSGLIANTTYYWRVYSYRESISAPVDASATTLPASKFFTTSSGNWSDPSIWNTLSVPGAQDSAEISAGHNVVLNFSGLSCGTLIVKGNLSYSNTTGQIFIVNGDVLVETGGTFSAGTATGGFTPNTLYIGGTSSTANIPGSLTVNGTLDFETTNNVLVYFAGAQNATVTGTGLTCEMPFITCNKGTDSTTVLEFLRTYTQSAVTPTQTNSQRLMVLAGTLKLSAPVVTNSFFNTSLNLVNGSLSTPSGKLMLNHPGIALGLVPGMTSAMSVNVFRGEVQINSGSLTTGTGSGTFNVSTMGSVRLKGGRLTHFGSLSILSASTSGLYVEGGDLVLDPQGVNNLSTFTATLNVQANSNFTFTGGNILIVDPHQASGTSNSILIAAGGSKSVTGGTFIIGSDTSSTAGPTPSTTSGFGINIGIPVYNVTINNKGNTINSRYCRLVASLIVNNTLTLNANSYLTTGTGLAGFTITTLGNVVNNGVLSGAIPGTTSRAGRIDFTGTTAQTVSGNGTTSYLTARIANTAGVNFTNTSPWILETITLEKGNVNNGASTIQMGNTDYFGTIIIGGQDETITAGSFSAVPVFNTTFGMPSYIYGPASNTLQTGSFNEMGAGAQTVGYLTINDAQGVTANRNLVVQQTLTLNQGNLKIGNNTLTIGTSTSSPGSLVRNSGFVVMGNSGVFTRWFSTANPAYNYNNGFPISTGTNDRSVLMNISGFFNTGYNLSVKHNNTIGFTDIVPSFTDGITIDRRTNSNWVITSTSNPSFAGTFNLRVVGAGIGALTDPQQLRLIGASNVLAGTSAAGGGTAAEPQINKNFSQIQLIGLLSGSTSIYIGTNSAVNPLSPTITAINTGDWNDVNTWEGGVIPTITNNAVIAAGVTVTIPASYTATCNGLTVSAGATLLGVAGGLNNAGNLIIDGTVNNSGSNVNIVAVSGTGLTVNSGGTLTISSGTFNLGPSGGSNRQFLLNGTLNVSGGTLNVNGNIVANAGSSFNQSGGDINIDGNDGTAAGSAAQGEHLLSFPGPSASTINCSGGTITIVDPPYAGHGPTTTYALRINSSVGSLSSFTGTHTLRLGDGSSSTLGNSNGFIVDTKRSSGRNPLQNVIVNGGSGSGRWTSAAITSGAGTHIKGSLIVNAGSEFRHTLIAAPLAIGGNITNNGTLTLAAPLILGGEGYVITNAQTIDGAGTFRNSTTSSTGAFTSLTLSNGTGLTLNTSNTVFAVTGTLSLNDLKITTNSNTIVTTASGLNRGSGSLGYIVGNLGKNITAGSNNAYTFEIGTASNYLPVTVTYPSVIVGGVISAGINTGLHPQLASSCLNPAKTIGKYWTLTNNGAVTTGGNYTFNFLVGDVPGGTNLAFAKTFAYDGSAWDGGATGSGSTSTFTVNGLNIYGDIAVGEITPVPTSVSISTASNTVCAGSSVTFTATVTNGGSAPTYQWKLNGGNVGTSSSTYSTTTLATNDVVTCETVSNSPCVSIPNATSNTITMTVSPLTVGGDVSGGTTICSGSTSAVLTLSGHTGSVTNWQYAVAPFGSFTDTAITSTTFTSGALSQTTRFRAIVKSGACAAMISDTTEVTVTPPSNAGSISGNTSVCSGSSAGNLSVTGHTGTVLRWETATNAAFTANFTSTVTSLTTFSAGSPTQTTFYRVIVKNGVCAEATSASHTITVTPASVGGTVGNAQTICAGGSPAALNLTGNVGTVVRWESSTDALFTTPVTIPSSAGLTSLSPTPSSSTYYRAVVQNAGCALANSAAALITINAAPGGGSITGPASLCTGSGPGNLQISGHTGSIVQWQTQTAAIAPAWANTGSSGNPYNPGTLTQTTKYRVELSNTGCSNGFSNELTITVSSPSVAGAVSGTTSVCSGSSAGNLSLSGNTGTIKDWLVKVAPATSYSVVSPQNLTSTQNAGSPTAETRYRVIVQNGSCPQDTTAEHVISITPPSVGGSVTPATANVCSGNSSGSLSLSGHTGTVVKWQYAKAPGFVYVDTAITATSFTSGPLTVTTRFRAVVSSGGCASANSAYAEITVNSPSAAGSISGTTSVCSGSSAGNLSLSGNTGTIKDWLVKVAPATSYSVVSPQNLTSTQNAGSPTAETRYRVIVQNGSCPQDTTAEHVISITPTSVGGSVTPATANVCSGNSSGSLSLSGHTGTVVKWQYAKAPGFVYVDTAITTTSFISGPLTVTTRFRAVVSSGGCASANSAYAEITVNSLSAAGSISGTTSVCSGSSAGNLSLSGNTGTVKDWLVKVAPATSYSVVSPQNLTSTQNAGSPTAETRYRVIVQNGSCPQDTTAEHVISVTPASVGGSITPATANVCSGNNSGSLSLSGHTGTVVKWQYAKAPGFVYVDTAITTTSFISGPLTVTTRFRAVVSNGGCSSANSAYAEIAVNAAASAGTLANLGAGSLCIGSTGPSLELSGYTGSIVRWEKATAPSFTPFSTIGGATSDTYATGAISATTDYRVVVSTPGCSEVTSNTVRIQVDSGSLAGSATTTTTSICSGSTPAQLSLSGTIRGSVTRWESSDVAPYTVFSPIASSGAATYQPGSLSVTTHFRAVVSNGACASATSVPVAITVTPGSSGGTVIGSTPVCSGSSTSLSLSGHTGSVTTWESATAPFTSYTILAGSAGQTSISPAPSATTRYRAVVTNGSCPSANSNEFEVEVVSGGIWTGIINGNWNNAGNWCGGVPSASTNVTIPSGTLNSPSINTTSAVANNVTIDAGATLSFSGSTNVLSIAGNLTVNGTFNVSNGTVTYNGATAQNVAGLSYSKLRLNGTGVKSLTGNATVTGNIDLNSGNLQLGSSNLVLTATATVTGGSASSYVITDGTGVLTRNSVGSTPFVFHVGNGSYTPVTVTNNGTADDYSLLILPNCYNNYAGFTGSIPMSQKVVNRTFIIQEAVSGGSLLDIDFQWNSGDELPSMDRSRMIVGHYTGSWTHATVTPQNITSGSPYKISLSAFPLVGIFGVGDEDSPLPVKWLSFDAKLAKGAAMLNWITASEINNSHFVIERATDGINYRGIGEVKGKGNTGSKASYAFTDLEAGVLLETANVLYYRLKQYDFNGSFSYSTVVTVSSFKTAGFEIVSMVPNPFHAAAKISYYTSSASPVQMMVVDAFGKVVSTAVYQPKVGVNSIDIGPDTHLAAGVYFVRLTQDDNTRIRKIVKE